MEKAGKIIEIGSYKIEWIDVDHVLITKHYSDNIIRTAKIAGGDMETFLNSLFLGAEMTYKSGNMTTKTMHKTTYDED